MVEEPDRQASEPAPTTEETAPAPTAESAAETTSESRGWRYRIARTAETMLREQPLLYKPIAKPLRRLTRFAGWQRMLSAAQQGDLAQNAATTPPPDENVQLAALWVIEFYTPSTVGQLARALRKLRWLHSTDEERDYSFWLTDQRARATEAYVEIATITPEKPFGLYGKKGPVPGEFRAINLTLHAVTPSLTALVACFILSDDTRDGLMLFYVKRRIRRGFAGKAL